LRKITLEIAIVLTAAIGLILVYGALGNAPITDDVESYVISVSIEELKAMPRTVEYARLDCVGNPVAEGNWTGVRLELLLERVRSNNIQTIEFRASDGYSRTLTSSEAAREDVIIAYLLNGNPIQEKMRLVVPYRNGDQWISDIVEIRVIDISGDYSTIYISS
jgi:DMSO/TMAO reductase YedYZ molybdopterin-dependent catalytic subunit